MTKNIDSIKELINELEANNYICDGCNVLGYWEHRCHGKDGKYPCTCQQCLDNYYA